MQARAGNTIAISRHTPPDNGNNDDEKDDEEQLIIIIWSIGSTARDFWGVISRHTV